MELFVMRVDSTGNSSWLKIYQEHYSGYVPRIEKTQDGGYIVSASATTDQGWDFWVLKLNSEGTIPGCDAIVDAEAIIIDYSISTQDTEAIIQSPAITLYDIISCEAVEQTTTISAICQYDNLSDMDGDGIENTPGGTMTSSMFLDSADNCPDMPNGPFLGTCIQGNVGSTCISDEACGVNGICSMNQEDTFPPQGNNIGDACDCESDFDCSGGVDANDVTAFLVDFGRSTFFNPCNNADPCNGDVDCNANVDAADVNKFLEDFGRSQFNNPCPSCVAGDWCEYP
jgi:hypothetical protein